MTRLETVTDSLAEGYKQLQPDSFQTAAELTTARRTDPELRKRWFWTANLGLYRNNGEELQYGIGGRQTFNAIAGSDIEEFCRQLLANHNYRLTLEQTQQIGNLDDFVWVNPNGLGLQGDNSEWRYFAINPSNPSTLNQAQRAFAEAVYGNGNDFAENMQMLAKANIRTTKIYVLNSDYVRKHTEQGQAIARACWLYDFDYYSDFGSDIRGVDDSNGLRGVRSEKVRESGRATKTRLC